MISWPRRTKRFAASVYYPWRYADKDFVKVAGGCIRERRSISHPQHHYIDRHDGTHSYRHTTCASTEQDYDLRGPPVHFRPSEEPTSAHLARQQGWNLGHSCIPFLYGQVGRGISFSKTAVGKRASRCGFPLLGEAWVRRGYQVSYGGRHTTDKQRTHYCQRPDPA